MAKNDIFGIGKIPNIGGFNGSDKDKTDREAIPSFWKANILRKQNNLCAGRECANYHNGKAVQINSTSNFDHIKPLALKGKHSEDNLQGLCPNCHNIKTKEDRYNITQKNKKEKSKSDNNPLGVSNIFGKPPKSSKNNPFGF